jgi:hypothetical protein
MFGKNHYSGAFESNSLLINFFSLLFCNFSR